MSTFSELLREHDPDLVIRLVTVAFILSDVFDNAGAVNFIKLPQKVLGGRVPFDLCRTDEGFVEVLDAVQSIVDGNYV